MDAGYVKVSGGQGDDDLAAIPDNVRADPGLACWAALVHAWDGIEGELDDDEPPGPAAVALTDVRPFA